MIITLTKKEQILGLKMLNSSISKDDQKLYISHSFYRTISKLRKLGLIRSVKNGRKCSYVLTTDGKIIFSIMSGFKGNEEFKNYAIKGTRLISFS